MSNRYVFNEEHARMMADVVVRTLIERGAEYGDAPINTLGPDGVAKMVAIKADRLLNLYRRGDPWQKREDSWIDAAGYAILGAMADRNPDAIPIGAGGIERPVAAPGLSPPSPRVRAVYLCGPIDGVHLCSAREWRRHASEKLCDAGILAYSPAHAFMAPPRSPETDEIIMAVDRAVIRECDALLANLSGNCVRIGSLREIEYATSLGKRVVVIPGSTTPSVWLNDLTVVASIQEAVSFLMGAE